jgi:hypothetical protein
MDGKFPPSLPNPEKHILDKILGSLSVSSIKPGILSQVKKIQPE